MSFEIGKFGDYQKLFKDRTRKNNGYIEKLNVTSGEINSNKYFQMVFIPKLSSNDTVKHWFTVRFEKHNEVDCMITITVNSENDVHTLKSQHDNSTVDKMCSEWLVEVLFKKKYKYKVVSLMLPPSYDWLPFPEDKNSITKLEITVGDDELASGIVNSWFSKFPNSVDSLQITSNDSVFQIQDNPFLRNCKEVEIRGKSNIDTNIIKYVGRKIVVHRGGEFKKFEEEELKQLCEYYIENDVKKAIFLEQGTEAEGHEIIRWLKNLCAGYYMKGERYFLQKEKEGRMYQHHFNMTGNKITLGNFDSKYHPELDSTTWPLKFLGLGHAGISC